jgi:multiple sugar transport system permease protein
MTETSPARKIKGVSYAKYGYMFCIPFMVVWLFFSLYPTIYTAIIGFTDLKGAATRTYKFLPDLFANYNAILSNATFQKSFVNTLTLWIINFIPQICLAMLLAYWFTGRRRDIKAAGFFKVMFYMPNIITAASVAILFNTLFGYPFGPINDILKSLGLRSESYNFAYSPWASKLIVSFIQFWQWYGYTAIILISGVLGVNPELFESAEIDGASRGQTFWKITLPSIRTILVFTLITSLIGGLNMFEVPKLFNNGGPVNETSTVSVFIYNQAFSGTYQYNRASAASMIMFIIIAILSSVVFYLMRDRYESAQKKLARRAARSGAIAGQARKGAAT